jgi:hypothetical protein
LSYSHDIFARESRFVCTYISSDLALVSLLPQP